MKIQEKKQTLKFSFSMSASSIWQRQQIIMATHIVTYSKFATIKLDDFIQEGFESYKLKSSREDLGNGMYRLTAGWAIYPLIAGKQNISRDTIARMASFKRHQQHKDVPYSEGCGGLMWDAWGGTSGVEWAINKLKQIDKK